MLQRLRYDRMLKSVNVNTVVRMLFCIFGVGLHTPSDKNNRERNKGKSEQLVFENEKKEIINE